MYFCMQTLLLHLYTIMACNCNVQELQEANSASQQVVSNLIQNVSVGLFF